MYETETICRAARDINENSCIWTGLSCRAKRCEDAPDGTNSNSKCDLFLKGCKTDGLSCVDHDVTCSQIKSASHCCIDVLGNPCLWVKEKCYQYRRCDDIPFETHQLC